MFKSYDIKLENEKNTFSNNAFNVDVVVAIIISCKDNFGFNLLTQTKDMSYYFKKEIQKKRKRML